MKNLRVVTLQMLCLDMFFKGEAAEQNDDVTIRLSKKAIGHADKKSFLSEKWF